MLAPKLGIASQHVAPTSASPFYRSKEQDEDKDNDPVVKDAPGNSTRGANAVVTAVKVEVEEVAAQPPRTEFAKPSNSARCGMVLCDAVRGSLAQG